MSFKKKIISGVFWQGLERFGSQCISFIIQIWLARLLAPKDFGVVALMTVFIMLCTVVADSGFSNALIQKKDATQVDFCSVFFINIACGIVIYIFAFFFAPLMATFFNSPDLKLYLRISSLALVINSFSRVQQALLYKNMLFHLSFRINWCALAISGATGIVMAYCGFGIWALIAQQLCNAVMLCLLLWALVKWRPQWYFDWTRAKKLFQFGWKLLLSSFFDALYNDVYSFVIGKIGDLTTLSYYSRGKSIPALGMGVINSSIGSVLFPAFSQIQDDRAKMRELAKRGLQNIMFLVIPALTMLFVLAEPLVQVLLTDKWLPCVVYLRLYCIVYFYWPFFTTNYQIINACGRSDLYLIVEILKKTQGILLIVLTYRYGVLTMVAAGAAMEIVNFVENAWFNRKLINYPPWHQLWDIMPILFVAILTGGGIYAGVHFIPSPLLKLTVGITGFTALYLGGIIIAGKFPADIVRLFVREKTA